MFSQEYFCVLYTGGNLQKVHQNGYYDLNYIINYMHKNTLQCNLFPKVLSDVLFANYTQVYFQK